MRPASRFTPVLASWCQITPARPLTVHAVGARLTDDLREGMYNYGHLHVTFDDGSVGWYEAGWGPMMSETAFFVKDVIGPKGSVSIVLATGVEAARSDDINAHTQTNQLLVHHAALAPDGSFARRDERQSTADEPSHDDLCELVGDVKCIAGRPGQQRSQFLAPRLWW